MNSLQNTCLSVCYTCIAIAVLSLLIPQKRTRRIMSFVIGLFFIGTLAAAILKQCEQVDWELPSISESTLPNYDEDDYTDAVAQLTADNLTAALDELLQNEGISAEDIRLTLKISDEGRISVVRAVIYINESDSNRTADVERIIYRNVAKEPEIYVTGEEAQRVAE